VALLTTKLRSTRGQLLAVIILATALYVIVPQLSDFSHSWSLLKHPDPARTLLAIFVTALTYLAAAGVYCLLAFRPLRYRQALLIQLAAMFTNRLLPAGIGAVGANFLYLRGQRHSATQAGAVVAVNNLLGLIGHSLILITALSLAGHTSRLNTNMVLSGHGAIKYSLLVGVLLVITLLLIRSKRFKSAAVNVYQQLLSYRQRPLKLGAALLCSITLTLCNVLGLYFCALALGVHTGFIIMLVVFSLGIIIGSATPTPGGLGGFEASLVAGMVAYHIDSATALAVALLYRLISYWLTLGVGALAFIVVQRRRLLLA
jgi:uncharacterized membrane protein YbhN (UPF0104 family)